VGRRVVWRRTDVEGLAVARIDSYGDDDDYLQMDADEVVVEGRRSRATRIDIGAQVLAGGAWRADSAWVHVIGPDAWRSCFIKRAGPDAWKVNGRRSRRLDGCVEFDVAATPITNTFPIRNLGLEVGEERAIRVAWIDVPSLRITPEEQRYRRIGPATDGREAWEFVSSDGTRYQLTVDSDGLVVDYQGFATRV
jgi:uncharacterized protein